MTTPREPEQQFPVPDFGPDVVFLDAVPNADWPKRTDDTPEAIERGLRRRARRRKRRGDSG